MAKGYVSTTTIQYGTPEGETVTFAPGDPVTGLTKEQMAELWEAGALEEREVKADSDASAAAPSTSTSTTQPSGSDSPPSPKTGTEGGGTEGTKATPTA